MNKSTNVLDSLNAGLHRAFSQYPQVLIIGEDILDPYGGAFKVTKGLSTKFPDRVLTSPISEAGIVGIATGLALRGFWPIVEIMFGDFTTLIMDQVINHLAKFRYMYAGQVNVPVVIRTPMGGGRGYGATHSQTLEKLFLGIPGVTVIAPTSLGDPGCLLEYAITQIDSPVLFIESKLQYSHAIRSKKTLPEFDIIESNDSDPLTPSYRIRVQGAPEPQITIAAYGYMGDLAIEAVKELAYEHEIFSELVIFTQLAPFHTQLLESSLFSTGRLITLEEGTLSLGWGAEIAARMATILAGNLKRIHRIAARESHIPAAISLEKSVLPNKEDIILAASTILN